MDEPACAPRPASMDVDLARMIESLDNAHHLVGELHQLLGTVLHRLRQAGQLTDEDPAVMVEAARVFSDVVYLYESERLPTLSVQVHALSLAWKRAHSKGITQAKCR